MAPICSFFHLSRFLAEVVSKNLFVNFLPSRRLQWSFDL